METNTPGDGSFLRALTSGPMTGTPGSRPDQQITPLPAQAPSTDVMPANGNASVTRLEEEVKNLVDQDVIDKELEKARSEVKTIPMPSGPYSPYLAAGLVLGGVAFGSGLVAFIGSYALAAFIEWVLGSTYSILWPLAVTVLVFLSSPIAHFLINIENFLVTIKQGQSGVRRYFGEAVHGTNSDGKPDYAPLSTGLVLAPKPFFTVDLFDLGPQTYDIPNTNIVVQHPGKIEVSSDGVSTVAEGEKSTIDFGGKFTLDPDTRDFRSLIRLRDYTGGIQKAAVRVLNALLRNMQLYCAGPKGPHTQNEAVGMEQNAFLALKALSHIDIAQAGVIVSSMTPSILPPKIQLDAINEMNVEGAERIKELAHAQTSARARAATLTGRVDLTDAEVQRVLEKNPMSADLAAMLTAHQDGTIGPDSGIRYVKFDSGRDGGSSASQLIAQAKEIWNNGND